MYKGMHLIRLGKSADHVIPVIVYPANKIAGNADL